MQDSSEGESVEGSLKNARRLALEICDRAGGIRSTSERRLPSWAVGSDDEPFEGTASECRHRMRGTANSLGLRKGSLTLSRDPPPSARAYAGLMISLACPVRAYKLVALEMDDHGVIWSKSKRNDE